MSKKSNPAMVGAFVLGSAAIAIAVIIAFGHGLFTEEKYSCILYFDESIDGLDIGAPVDFMGVRIGGIVNIGLVVETGERDEFLRPVTVSLDAGRVTFIGFHDDDLSTDEWMESLIQVNGLRAQLATQSVLTGKLKIQFAFHPQTPIFRKNIPGPLLEIPTLPSTQETIKQAVEHIPFDAIMSDVHDAVNGIKELVRSPATGATLTNLNITLVRLDGTLTEVDRFLKSCSTTLQNLDGAITNAALLIAGLEAGAGPLLESLAETSRHLNTILDEGAPTRVAAYESLEELQNTLRSIGNLADYLQRHPESLLRGK